MFLVSVCVVEVVYHNTEASIVAVALFVKGQSNQQGVVWFVPTSEDSWLCKVSAVHVPLPDSLQMVTNAVVILGEAPALTRKQARLLQRCA